MKWMLFKYLRMAATGVMALVGVVAVFLAVLDMLQLTDWLEPRQIWVVTLLLSGGIAAYLIFERWDMLEPMRKDIWGHGTSRVLQSKADIYGRVAAKMFYDLQPRFVRVYAPSGLWREDKHKRRWLKSVKQAVSWGHIEQFRAVFGLPPTVEGFIYMKDTLIKLFESGRRMDNVFLRFVPPPDAGDVPSMVGVIIMDTQLVGIGLACTAGDPVVDMTIMQMDSTAASKAVEWFDEKIWRECERQEYVFGEQTYRCILKHVAADRKTEEHVHLRGALERIEKMYYGEAAQDQVG